MTKKNTKKRDTQRELRIIYNSNKNKNIGRRLKSKSNSKKLIKNKDVLVKYGGNRVVNRDIHSIKIQRELSGGSDYATDILKKAYIKLDDLKENLDNIKKNVFKNSQNVNKLTNIMNKDFKTTALGFFEHNTVSPLQNLKDEFKYLKMFQYTPDIMTDKDTIAILKTNEYNWFNRKRGLSARIYRCISPEIHNPKIFKIITFNKLDKIANQLICAISKFRINEFEVTNINYDIYNYLLKYDKKIETELKDDILTETEKQHKQLFKSGLSEVKTKYDESVKTTQNPNSPINYTVFEPLEINHGAISEKISLFEYIIGIMKQNPIGDKSLTADEKIPILKAINSILTHIITSIDAEFNNKKLYSKYFDQQTQNNIQQLCALSAFMNQYSNLMNNTNQRFNSDHKLSLLSHSLIFRDLGYYIELQNSPDYANPYYELPYYLKFYINKFMPGIKKLIDFSHIMPNDIGIPETADNIKNYELTELAFISILWNSYKNTNDNEKWKNHKNYENIIQSIFLYISNKLSKLARNNINDNLNAIHPNLNYGFFIDYVFNTINYVNTYESILTRMMRYTKFYRDFDDAAEKIFFEKLDGVGCVIFEVAKKAIQGLQDGRVRYQINSDGQGAIIASTAAGDAPNFMLGINSYDPADPQYAGEIRYIEELVKFVAKACEVKKADGTKFDYDNSAAQPAIRIAISEAAKKANPRLINMAGTALLAAPENFEQAIPENVAAACALRMCKHFPITNNRGDIMWNTMYMSKYPYDMVDNNVDSNSYPIIPAAAPGANVSNQNTFVESASFPGSDMRLAYEGGLTLIRRSKEYLRILDFVPQIAEAMYRIIMLVRSRRPLSFNTTLQAAILSDVLEVDINFAKTNVFKHKNVGEPVAAGATDDADDNTNAVGRNLTKDDINKEYNKQRNILKDIANEMGPGGMEVMIQMAVNMSNAFAKSSVSTLQYTNAASAAVAAVAAAADVGGSAAAAATAAEAAVNNNIIYSALMSASQSEMFDKHALPLYKTKFNASLTLRATSTTNIITGDTYINRANAAYYAGVGANGLGDVTRQVDLHQFIDDIAVGSLAAESAVSGDNLNIYATAIPYIFKCLIKTYKDTLTATRDTAELILTSLKALINDPNNGILGAVTTPKEINSQDNVLKISAAGLAAGAAGVVSPIQEECDALLNGCIAVFRGFPTDTPARGLGSVDHNTFVNSSLARAVARATTINTTCEYIKFKVRIMNMREHFNNDPARTNSIDPFEAVIAKKCLSNAANLYVSVSATEIALQTVVRGNPAVVDSTKDLTAYPVSGERNILLDSIIFNKNKIYDSSNDNLFTAVINFRDLIVNYVNIMTHMARFCYQDLENISIETTKLRINLYSIFLKFLNMTFPAMKKIILYNAAHRFIYLYKHDKTRHESRFLDIVSLLQLYENTLKQLNTHDSVTDRRPKNIAISENLFNNIKIKAFDNSFTITNDDNTRNLFKKNLIVIMIKISTFFYDEAKHLTIKKFSKLIDYFNEIHSRTTNKIIVGADDTFVAQTNNFLPIFTMENIELNLIPLGNSLTHNADL
jgi:hypothetical protein